jgi:PAS domain S-box-containing protein
MARILVVEDEVVTAWNIQEALTEFGHTVVSQAISGAEAIEAAIATRPDLVLMDIRLKGKLDGIAAAQEIYPTLQIPIIYLTAHTDDATLRRAIASNPFGYLVKPFRKAELYSAIQVALHRHLLESKLQRTEQWLSTTLSSIADGTIAVDSDGCITFMNPAAEDLTGWELEEALGKAADRVLRLVDPHTGEAIANPLLQALQEGARVNLPDDCLLHAKDGTTRAVGDSASPIRSTNGIVMGSVAIFQDITERRQAEIIQRQHQEQHQAELERLVQERTATLQKALAFEALLKRITDRVRDSLDEAQILQTAVQELTLGLDIYSCDTGLYNLAQSTSTIRYEYIQEQIPVGLGTVTLMADHQPLYDRLLQGEAFQFGLVAGSDPRSGRPIDFQTVVLACPLIDDQGVIGDMWLYRSRDTCFEEDEVRLVQQVANQCAIALRQARLYRAAQAQVAELERLHRLKDEFLDSITHELRTPLSIIHLTTQMLEIRLRQLNLLDNEAEPSKRYLKLLQEEIDHESSLINDLLELSRITVESELDQVGSVRLQDWIPHLLEPFAMKADQQNLRLHLEMPSDLPLLVVDLSHLLRILTELLTNALRFTPESNNIHLQIRGWGDRIQFSISNSGAEIPCEELPRIFDKFYRVPQSDPWRYRGTGLGLALVKRLVRHMGGTIAAASLPGKTTFTVSLPWQVQSFAND